MGDIYLTDSLGALCQPPQSMFKHKRSQKVSLGGGRGGGGGAWATAGPTERAAPPVPTMSPTLLACPAPSPQKQRRLTAAQTTNLFFPLDQNNFKRGTSES